jgi:hypothetical protein
LTAVQLAAWLRLHGHTDVVISDEALVESNLNGKVRRYELRSEVLTIDGSLFDEPARRTSYWRRVH